MPAPFRLFAACLPGLEPLLQRELQTLGYTQEPLAGGVAFEGDPRAVFATSLWLGTASHVRVRLAEFPCRALGELERKASLLPWAQWLRPDVPLRLRATAQRSRIYHTGAVEQRIERAVAHALGRQPPRPMAAAEPDADDTAAVLAVRVHEDVVTVSLDATTSPLHRRGYRLATAKAPLREDIAHALLLAAGFAPGLALLDPMCGAGTIAIEAAAIALGLPPGRLRPPPLRHTALWDERLWQQVVADAAARTTAAANATTAPIAASDRDRGAIEAARANAERAGVAAAVAFTCCALAAQPWLAAPTQAPPRGLLATNPPFGRRVGQGHDLLPLYQTLGHRLQRLGAGWRLALLAHDDRLARRSGIPLETAFSVRHGGLSVRALVQRTDSARPG